ncbi:hypothetical protein COOONC_25993 [Cooperia oncophora]
MLEAKTLSVREVQSTSPLLDKYQMSYGEDFLKFSVILIITDKSGSTSGLCALALDKSFLRLKLSVIVEVSGCFMGTDVLSFRSLLTAVLKDDEEAMVLVALVKKAVRIARERFAESILTTDSKMKHVDDFERLG